MPLTYYAQNRILNHYFGTRPLTPALSYYLALFTAVPNLSGGGTEVVGGDYSRPEIPNDAGDATDWIAAVNGALSNAQLIQFPTPTANWGSIVAVGLYDDPAAGNLEAFYTLPTPKPLNTGDNYAFPIGNIIARLTSP